MVKMENYYSPQNRLHELCEEIDKCHFSYLQMEESPEKIEHRNKLEDYIHEFLCLVTPDEKFTFPEAEEVLYKSASFKKDFSAYKAATGFNAIQLYAGNLLAQPWRKEYRQIKTYCGFYKHQIEANLVQAEIMFEALGYDHVGNGLLVMNGPMCMDRIIAFSRDCLIAYVECQIIKTIWEEGKVSWLEVIEYRKSHACSPELAIKGIKFRQRQYQEHTRSYSQGSDPYSNGRCQNIPIPALSPVLPANHSFPPLSSHHHVGLPTAAPEYMYPGGCCQNNYGTTLPHCAYYTYNQPLVKPQFNINGYYYNGYVASPPQPPTNYIQPVPTANLIEVESPLYTSKEAVLRSIQNTVVDSYKTKNNNDPLDRNSDKNNDPQFENWDYVYKNLESQGYSKDLGERGDVLSPKQLKEAKKMVKSTNLDEVLNNLTVSDRPLKINEALKKVEMEKKSGASEVQKTREVSPPSSYENLTSVEEKKKVIVPTAGSVKISKERQPVVEKQQVQQKLKEDKNKNSVLSPDKWQCKACTYLNNSAKDICDMCSKSRFSTTDPPMEIGGAECWKCTLVNPKRSNICEACGASLKDSPTYI